MTRVRGEQGDSVSTSRDGSGAPQRWPLALAGLALAVSTVLIGQCAGALLPLVPLGRVGNLEPLGPAESARLGAAAQVVWVLAHVLAAARQLSAPGDRATGTRRVLRLSLATLGLAVALVLPFQSWSAARALARGRYLLGTYALVVALAMHWLFLRGARAERPPGRLRDFSWLGTGAVLLVLCGETVIDLGLLRTLRYVPGLTSYADLLLSLALNSALVLACIGAFLAISGRPLFSFLTVAVLYAVLVFANIQKLINLQSPLSVQDAYYLAELRTVLTGFVAPAVLGALVGVLGVALFGLAVVYGRTVESSTRALRALGVGVLAVAGVAAWAAALPAAARPESGFDPRKDSLNRGLAFDLLIGCLTRSVEVPPDYSDREVRRILEQRTHAPERTASDAGAPSLVLLLVESLMDPAEFGFELSEDPLPFLHSLAEEGRFGACISPAFGSQSANVEFELLTGMSMGFLPQGSLAYRQYLHQRTPSLARSLGDLGYRVQAIIVDPQSFFDRPRCYKLLGFDEVAWLDEVPGIERDVGGKYASDEAVVDAILAMDEGEAPFFAFAFSNASHAPYDPAPYGPDAVAVVDAPSERVRRDLGGYANAVRAVDRATERLVTHFRGSARPTLVVVLGDHMPPFSGPAGVYEESEYFLGSPREQLLRRHSVPIWIWANYDVGDLEGSGDEPLALSANFVGLTVLDALGIEPDPFLQVVRAVETEYDALSRVVVPRGEEARGFKLQRERRNPLVHDYEILQYELLFGDGLERP